jgi:hypothetical protein
MVTLFTGTRNIEVKRVEINMSVIALASNGPCNAVSGAVIGEVVVEWL